MRLVFGEDALVAAWMSQRLGNPIGPPYIAFGLTADEKTLCGGAAFSNWNGANIEMAIVLDCIITRGFIRAIYNYAFIQCGALRLSARTRRSNRTANRILPRLGFKFEGVAKSYYGPNRADDAICYVLFSNKANESKFI